VIFKRDLKTVVHFSRFAAVVFAVLILLLRPSYAQSVPIDSEELYLNIGDSYIECSAMYSLFSKCFAKNSKNVDLVNSMIGSANLSFLIADEIFKQTTVSQSGIAAKSKLFFEKIDREMSNSCSNVSVPLVRIGEICKYMIDSPAKFMEQKINEKIVGSK
jgi:hypothetical protein